MTVSSFEQIVADYEGITLDLSKSPSSLTALERVYPKLLIVAAASSLEDRVKNLIPRAFLEHGNSAIATFVTAQVFKRSYHTLFDWPSLSAKPFFSQFGDECKKNFNDVLRSDTTISDGHYAFMKLGAERNNVVHNDFPSRTVDLSVQDVCDLYPQAMHFADSLPRLVGLPFSGPEPGDI